MNINACLSHNSDDWRTPTSIFNFFIKKIGCIDTFPYQCSYDEFTIDRGSNIKLFCNPPYSKLKFIPQWVRHNVIDLNNKIYLLIPCRTDTKYWGDLLELCPHIYFIKGRLRFNDKGCAPFPSVLLVFIKNSNLRFYDLISQEEISYE